MRNPIYLSVLVTVYKVLKPLKNETVKFSEERFKLPSERRLPVKI